VLDLGSLLTLLPPPDIASAVASALDVRCTNCGLGYTDYVGAVGGLLGALAALIALVLAKQSAKDAKASRDAAQRSATAAEENSLCSRAKSTRRAPSEAAVRYSPSSLLHARSVRHRIVRQARSLSVLRSAGSCAATTRPSTAGTSRRPGRGSRQRCKRRWAACSSGAPVTRPAWRPPSPPSRRRMSAPRKRASASRSKPSISTLVVTASRSGSRARGR
jgi:hypothetical protein